MKLCPYGAKLGTTAHGKGHHFVLKLRKFLPKCAEFRPIRHNFDQERARHFPPKIVKFRSKNSKILIQKERNFASTRVHFQDSRKSKSKLHSGKNENSTPKVYIHHSPSPGREKILPLSFISNPTKVFLMLSAVLFVDQSIKCIQSATEAH